jgi:riboflavin kinase/FMN adenylyltransferase
LQGHVITLGTFDGVHRAHHSIIDSIVELADEKSCESVLITFEPHPRSIIYPQDSGLRLLTDLDEKLALLQKTKLDHVVVHPFTVEFSQQPPEEYIENFIIGKFKPKGIIVGFDHRFGLNRQGDYDLLKSYTDHFGIELIEISKKESNHVKISSTAIREAIVDGNIKIANQLLGYRYFLSGSVIKGDSIGTSLGYPTANLRLTSKHKLVPRSGIYAAFVYVQNERYDGLLYIGHKPSVHDGQTIYIEVNLREFEGYLYGENLKIELVDFIRADEKFVDLEALKQKIREDELKIVDILEAEKNAIS